MADARDEIARIEEEIEALAEKAEGCRKAAAASKALAGLGGVLILLTLIGALGHAPLALVLGIGGLLGGIALQGSNRSTLEETRGAIRELEARRAALIGGIGLRLVRG
jgi:Na+/H+ antiporter NhaD/arsenite permease-like protein